MCIILTCEKNVRPTHDLIETCFYNNPDGAGIMWVEDGEVQISKGFVDVKSLMEAIDYVPMDSRLVIHMRIATSGGIDVGTCHPFPVCNRLEALHAANVECPVAIAHNGVISSMPTDNKLGISDTISFVQLVVNDLFYKEGVTKSTLRRIKKLAPGNRFAVMTNDGMVYRLGVGWETVTKGIQASNSSWSWSTYYYYSARSPKWSWVDDDDWYDDDYKRIFDSYCGDCLEKGTCMLTEPFCPMVRDMVEQWYLGDEYYQEYKGETALMVV